MTVKLAMRNVLIGASLAAALAGCGGPGGGRDTPPDPPTVVATSQEDKFGVKFGQNFRAAAHGEPSPVSDGDLVPVSWTTEPIDIVP